MAIEQKDIDQMNVQFVSATARFTLDEREFLMRDYSKALNEGGIVQAQAWLRALELSPGSPS